jgi:hypothetical protein
MKSGGKPPRLHAIDAKVDHTAKKDDLSQMELRLSAKFEKVPTDDRIENIVNKVLETKLDKKNQKKQWSVSSIISVLALLVAFGTLLVNGYKAFSSPDAGQTNQQYRQSAKQ